MPIPVPFPTSVEGVTGPGMTIFLTCGVPIKMF